MDFAPVLPTVTATPSRFCVTSAASDVVAWPGLMTWPSVLFLSEIVQITPPITSAATTTTAAIPMIHFRLSPDAPLAWATALAPPACAA